MGKRPRFVILISGNGSNLQAVLDACHSGKLNAEVGAVISDRADAYGLRRAMMAGIPAIVLEKKQAQERSAYDLQLAQIIRGYRPDWVIMAGWMRILSMEFLSHFRGRVINLHPALPGMYPGTHAIERAYAAYKNGEIDASGIMVHLVPDEGVDTGPVLGVRKVAFIPGESLEQFEQHMHAAEHQLLVDTLKRILNKEVNFI